MARKFVDDRSIARTALVLDQIKPDWYKEVTKPLDMFDGRVCVLGQVFRKEARSLAPNESGYGWATLQPFYGDMILLVAPSGAFSDRRMAPLWEKEIAARRNPVPASRLRRMFGWLPNKLFRLAA